MITCTHRWPDDSALDRYWWRCFCADENEMKRIREEDRQERLRNEIQT